MVAWGSVCEATHKDEGHLQSNQDEADTKMILRALDATANGATKLLYHSPDTDVFVLALRRYPELCVNTLFVTGRGQHHRIIELKPIVETLGPEKIAVLLAFHALSGADNTKSFSGKGNKRVQITESVFILIKLVTCPIFVILISLKQFIKHIF